MAEKRARKDVKRLSAKVDAFIRNVDRKSAHHHPHSSTRSSKHHTQHHEHHEQSHPHQHAHAHPEHSAPHHTAEHAPAPRHTTSLPPHNHPAQPTHHEQHHTQHHEHPHPHQHAHEPPESELPPMPAPPRKPTPPVHHEAPTHVPHTPSMKVKKELPSSYSRLDVRDEREIAVKFASQVHKKFTSLIKATVLFGSQAKRTATPSSDIDIVVIVDDASVNWDLELIAWYREELGKLVANNKYAHELHINTIKLTTWWQDLINGDPVVLNILRYGEPLIDVAGFFKPIKALLQQGKIHSTPESVYNALQRAPMHLSRSRASELGAIEGVYWTMVDSAQAALITAGQLPPSPEHMTLMLKETFVDKGLMKGDFVYWYRDCFALHKAIIHGHVTNLKGADIDIWQDRAEQFMKKMTEIIDHLLSTK